MIAERWSLSRHFIEIPSLLNKISKNPFIMLCNDQYTHFLQELTKIEVQAGCS